MERIKVKTIVTIGPSSNRPEVLEKLKDRKVSFFRINLSHTREDQIEERVKDLLGYGVPIIIDTEGSQIRSGNQEEIEFREGEIVKIHNKIVNCDSENLFFTPVGVSNKLNDTDLISIEFNTVLLRVIKKYGDYSQCVVIMGGIIGGRKGVQIESQTFKLPAFSNKDHNAIEIAKKHGIKHFTLSFMESAESVQRFKNIYPEAIIYSKIESKKGVENFDEIANISDGILIDRGDLGSQVALEKIPFIQKYLTEKVRSKGKEVFVATNTLEQMALSLKPNKAEINDIVNTLLDGATGIALTKEVAVGKYPVETVNMLNGIISQIDFLQRHEGSLSEKIEKSYYLNPDKSPELLIKPHGGKLVERFKPKCGVEIPDKKIEISEEALMDVEQIAIGAFSPLEGFMKSKDFHSVVENMTLSNGTVWPLPITLDVSSEIISELTPGKDVALSYKGEIYAILHLEEIYQIDRVEASQKIYGTRDASHPGVKRFLEGKDFLLGGKVTLLRRRDSEYKVHELTPKQTRKIFAERGWSKVVGFHTRNVIHRSHEFIQLEGLRRGLCDGLFVHPVIGKKKPGDFESEVIVNAYEKMIDKFYPNSKAVLGTFATYSRYCGPREALFTALVRKNFGCSHFIVGRDHTGVGNFYHPHASHEIFKKFSQFELGIEPIIFDKVFYSELEHRHIHERDFIEHPEEHKLHISGTEAREMFLAGKQPPEWFMRPEISQLIIGKINKGEKVFVK